MIKFHEDPMECKNELISAALSAGGYDNVTIAVANIQTDEEPEEPAEEKEEEKKDEEKKDEEEANEEELSTTIRTEVIGHRSHKKLYITLILLLIIIGAGAYIWLAKECEPLRQTIVTNVTPYWEKLIAYFK